MSLTINVATVYPKEILSSGNTVARHEIGHTLNQYISSSALLMIFYAHVHMHQYINISSCLLFGTCHTFAEFFHVTDLPFQANKT